MSRILLLLTLALLVFSSCNSDNRHHVEGENLSVYYFDESEGEVAEKIAYFWKNNDLVTGNQQDLQVRKVGKEYVVSMIAKDSVGVKEMPFSEAQLLNQLKRKLYVDVFEMEPFTLEICNNKFEAIYTVE